MHLDNNPYSRSKINEIINKIPSLDISSLTTFTTISVHDADNFHKAIEIINQYKIDLIIINISSIELNKYIDDCVQLRNVYSFAPIVAISSSDKALPLDHYSFIGFDDILDINIINESILTRVIRSAIQRAKTYHIFHTTNQRKLISSRLLKLLLDKKKLSNVAQSATDIIHSQNSSSNNSSASIYTIENDQTVLIAHTGKKESDIDIDNYKKKLQSLMNNNSNQEIFSYLKINKKFNSKKVRVIIPLKNFKSIFAFLKIESENGIAHPSEERKYYKDISKTLSDIILLAQERERFEQVYQQNVRLIDEMSSAAIGIDNHDRVTHWNHQAEIYFSIANQNALNERLFDLKMKCDWPIIISNLYNSINKNVTSDRFEVSYRRLNEDKDRVLSVAITPFVEPNGVFTGYLLLMDDVTEKKHMEKRHQQSMYLESIGQLSAGIAHEINTPMQYISDNLEFLKSSFTDTTIALKTIKKSLLDKTLNENKLNDIFEQADFEYLSEELPLAFSQTTDGVNRVCSIVKAMKEYSHPNSEEKVSTNINQCIESTITISKHTWKYHSDMVTNLDPDLPEILVHPGPLNEVILNIIVNAADAIRDRIENNKNLDRGEIRIETRKKPGFAEIKIKDSGGGIPKKIQEKIFDPFFTTKSVGKGTGQGLALSYSIIKDRHNGELYFETFPGQGTSFIIQLPYK